MSPQRWAATREYLDEVIGREPADFAEVRRRARAAGLPAIDVGPAVGRALRLLASICRPRLIVEVGTLAGYSTLWLASALEPEGRIITIERDVRHAEFARESFAAAGLGEIVDLRIGDGHEVVRDLVASEPELIDVVFVDADKAGYPDYWAQLHGSVRVGGLAIFDNALGTGDTWIDHLDNPGIQATDELNRTVAQHDQFEAALFPIREGLLVARRIARS